MSKTNIKKFEKWEKAFNSLGYKRVEMYSRDGDIKYVRFEKTSTFHSYIQQLEFIHKQSGVHLLLSSQKGLNTDGFNNAVGLTSDELLAGRNLMKALGWYGQPVWKFNLHKRFYKCILSIKELFNSFKQVGRIHLMDIVWYKGEKWFVNNGNRVSNEGEQLWSILPQRTLPDGTRKGLTEHVPRTAFRRVFCWRNIDNALFHHYRWWRNCWRDIHVRQCLEGEYGKDKKN